MKQKHAQGLQLVGGRPRPGQDGGERLTEGSGAKDLAQPACNGVSTSSSLLELGGSGVALPASLGRTILRKAGKRCKFRGDPWCRKRKLSQHKHLESGTWISLSTSELRCTSSSRVTPGVLGPFDQALAPQLQAQGNKNG